MFKSNHEVLKKLTANDQNKLDRSEVVLLIISQIVNTNCNVTSDYWNSFIQLVNEFKKMCLLYVCTLKSNNVEFPRRILLNRSQYYVSTTCPVEEKRLYYFPSCTKIIMLIKIQTASEAFHFSIQI